MAHRAPGTRADLTRLQRWGLLVAFTLIVAFRLPNAWIEGRFQDEEATVFLAYAWHYPWFEALFRPFGGYWNLGATSTTVAVAWLVRQDILPLELAPYLTMSAGLFVQLLPAVLILTGRAEWLASRLAVIFALLIAAIIPATEEVFFNVLHIQFHLALCAALILAFDVPRRRLARLGYGLILFLAPLCGPGAIVLVPLFALRWLVDRNFGRAGQFGILAVGAAVQLLLFYGSSPIRGPLLEPHLVLAAMFVRLVALPSFGIDFADWVAMAMKAAVLTWLIAAAALCLFGALIVLAAQRRDSVIWLALSGLCIGLASLGFGIATADPAAAFYVTEGERYNFLPAVLIGWAVLALAARPGFRGKQVCAGLCLLMVLNGAYHYRRPAQSFADGPSWPNEVRAWRNDHDHPLAVWPEPFTADLSDQARPCSRPGAKLAGSAEPRYCESGWMATFTQRN